MNTLYPLKFKPILKEKIWGGNKLRTVLNKENAFEGCGESWEISAVEGSISVVANGFLEGNSLQELIEIYFGDLVGEKVYARFGIEFPLLVKFIDAADILSVQVHPDNTYAKKMHNAYGKNEMWYVIQADENSEIITGFNQTLAKDTFENHIKNNTIQTVINKEPVNKNDVFFIPTGRIHAIGAGVLLAEIQQTSDITYRVYDWNRQDKTGNNRELHINHALNVLDYSNHENYKTNYRSEPNKPSRILLTDYFTTNILEFDKKIQRDYNLLDSFVIYMCFEGEFNIADESKKKTKVSKGETILIPAALKNITLTPTTKSRILEVYIENIHIKEN